MERGMETFQRDYKLVEDGYKNRLDMKANSEASLPQSERMPSAENRFHAYLLASAISPPRSAPSPTSRPPLPAAPSSASSPGEGSP